MWTFNHHRNFQFLDASNPESTRIKAIIVEKETSRRGFGGMILGPWPYILEVEFSDEDQASIFWQELQTSIIDAGIGREPHDDYSTEITDTKVVLKSACWELHRLAFLYLRTCDEITTELLQRLKQVWALSEVYAVHDDETCWLKKRG